MALPRFERRTRATRVLAVALVVGQVAAVAAIALGLVVGDVRGVHPATVGVGALVATPFVGLVCAALAGGAGRPRLLAFGLSAVLVAVVGLLLAA